MPSGTPKRGRPAYEKIKALKAAKALLESNSAGEAYMKLHPDSTKESAQGNAYRMITPEVLAEVRRVLDLEKIGVASRENLEKLLVAVVAGWLQGKERTADYLTAIKLLKDLIVGMDIPTSEEELNDRLRKLGVNPDEASTL